jgi:membrane protein implicated in regulation of membrane protease activity
MDSELIIGAILVGIVCGLIPLVFGLVRGETALAWCGFAACILGGFLLGIILALPIAIVFTVLIWKNSKDRQTRTDAHAAVPAGPESMRATGSRLQAR